MWRSQGLRAVSVGLDLDRPSLLRVPVGVTLVARGIRALA